MNEQTTTDPLLEERAKTARLRFFIYNVSNSRIYQYQVMDAEQEPKVLAQFKIKQHAEGFVGWIREQYVHAVIQFPEPVRPLPVLFCSRCNATSGIDVKDGEATCKNCQNEWTL